MFIQFGHVFMFSAAYPLAGFWALLNNMLELKTDAFKICKLHQRPFNEPTLSIGAWQVNYVSIRICETSFNIEIIKMDGIDGLNSSFM